MIKNRLYKGKVIFHSLWIEKSEENTLSWSIEVSRIEMSPALAGSYTFKAKARIGSKSYQYHGSFNKVVISNNLISFYVTRTLSVNAPTNKLGNKPIIIIEFDEGEVSRLLKEDRWFKNESWFKVVIEDLQLSIF